MPDSSWLSAVLLLLLTLLLYGKAFTNNVLVSRIYNTLEGLLLLSRCHTHYDDRGRR